MLHVARGALAVAALIGLIAVGPQTAGANDGNTVVAQLTQCQYNCRVYEEQCRAYCLQQRQRCVSSSFGFANRCFDYQRNCESECSIRRSQCYLTCR